MSCKSYFSKVDVFIGLAISAVLLVIAPQPGTAKSAHSCSDGKSYPVALTFDDGPNPALTKRVLDTLKKHKAPATFFVLGDQFPTEAAKKQKLPILERMLAEGHIIGSHTYHHWPHSRKPAADAERNIRRTTDLLKPYLSPVLRLPFGDGSFRSKDPAKQRKNDQVMKMVKDAGFTHVGWDIDTNDWNPARRPYILSSMMSQICKQKGGIILFHDVQENTASKLSKWIHEIKAAGHTIVGLERFVPAAGKRMKTPENCPSCEQQEKPDPVGNMIEDLSTKTGGRR